MQENKRIKFEFLPENKQDIKNGLNENKDEQLKRQKSEIIKKCLI